MDIRSYKITDDEKTKRKKEVFGSFFILLFFSNIPIIMWGIIPGYNFEYMYRHIVYLFPGIREAVRADGLSYNLGVAMVFQTISAYFLSVFYFFYMFFKGALSSSAIIEIFNRNSAIKRIAFFFVAFYLCAMPFMDFDRTYRHGMFLYFHEQLRHSIPWASFYIFGSFVLILSTSLVVFCEIFLMLRRVYEYFNN